MIHSHCAGLLLNCAFVHNFHQLGTLGRVGIVVAKSVCVLFVCCVFVPFPYDPKGNAGTIHAKKLHGEGKTFESMDMVTNSRTQ